MEEGKCKCGITWIIGIEKIAYKDPGKEIKVQSDVTIEEIKNDNTDYSNKKTKPCCIDYLKNLISE